MAEEFPVWNLTESEWESVLETARGSNDALEDGGYVRVDAGPDTRMPELYFYATALNKPAGWRYPFLEEIPGSRQSGAFVGRSWHEPATGFVHFEVIVYAAAQAVTADYESGVADMDYVTYETAAARALRGTPDDLAWLRGEFLRLVRISSVRPV